MVARDPGPTPPTAPSDTEGPLSPAARDQYRSAGAEPGARLAGLDPTPDHRPLLLVPTLNEEAGLAATLEELRRVDGFPMGGAPDVLVVDGHSTDRTVEVAERAGASVLVQRGKGKGRAVRDGLAWAVARGYTAVGVIDADATYPADRLPAMFGSLADGADLVIGIRRPPSAFGGSLRDLVHRVGNHLLNLWAAEFSHRPILDVCSGFWGIRPELCDRLDLRSNGFEVESEVFLKVFRLGGRVVQFPIEYRPRIGEAKLHAARDGARILLSIVRHGRSSTPGPAAARRLPTFARPRYRAVGSLGALPAVLLSIDPASVLVAISPGRRREAERVARRLRGSGACADVRTAEIAPGGLASRPAAGTGGAPRRATSPDRSVIVALPEKPWGPAGPSTIVVEVPRERRVLVLGSQDPPALGSLTAADRGPDLRAESPIVGRAGSLMVLGASFDPSGMRKESALIRANAPDLDVGIFRRRPRRFGPFRGMGERWPFLRRVEPS